MTKTNEKIHVLADESLGGIKREYVEVDRKAEVGEKIVIVDADIGARVYKNEDVLYVNKLCTECEGDVFSEDAVVAGYNPEGLVEYHEYRVLAPTNIVHIDGERYEMVDRKAEVDEKIVIIAPDDDLAVNGDLGKIATVTEVFNEEDIDASPMGWVKRSEYRVLVPVESSEEEPQPSDPIDVIANLATRVAELERENKRFKDEIDTLHKDIRTIGEELESLKYAAKETDGKVAHLESDSDTRLFTAEEVIALLNEMRERQ
ncbi:hypothetical protein [Bacillus haynesii]|uniref:hypothetical protein n=1 Tax=Bacillus haynesii TaxID=1925021 RepID=UPI00398A84CD